MKLFGAMFVFCVTIAMATSALATEPVRVGSKVFTESVILGELATQLGNLAGVPTIHRSQLGGTRVLWDALLAGQIDIYPEYTGTAFTNVLKQPLISDQAIVLERVRNEYATLQLDWLDPLGFNNAFAMAVRGADAGSAISRP